MSFLKNLFNNLSGRQSEPEQHILSLIEDCHSHILPGVDDGIQSIDDSLAVLAEYEKRGCKSIWLTPHIMEDVPNTPEELRKTFAGLKEAYSGPIKLNLAAENMLDNIFERRLADRDLLPIFDNMLLVETSYFAPPANFFQLLENIFDAGYTPLLAHPERYIYMDADMYSKLKDMNIRFQLNMLSLVGQYGNTAKTKSRQLIAAGMYDHVGSDLHRLTQINAIDRLSSDRSAKQSLLRVIL